MQEPLNPYQPSVSVADAELIPFFSGPLEWSGHRFVITAEQIPLSLWLVGCIVVTIDESQVERFIKWRWHKRPNWTFMHEGNPCMATIQCSGANRIQCRLIVDGTPVGDSIVLAKGFWIGLVTVGIVTAGILSSVLYISRV